MRISAGCFGQKIDEEYLRIMSQLRSLGIPITGNKAIDKAKLKQAKEVIEEKFEVIQIENSQLKPEQAKLEEERSGATNLGLLNRILLGI